MRQTTKHIASACCILFWLGCALTAEPARANPAGLYYLDGPSPVSPSTIDDSSGEGNDGTYYHDVNGVYVVGQPVYQEGRIGEGISLLSKKEYIRYRGSATFDALAGDDKFTFSAWVFPHTQPGSLRVIYTWGVDSSGNQGYALELANQTLKLYYLNDGETPEIPTTQKVEHNIPLNRWSHVGVTYDADNAQLVYYLNGVPYAQYAYELRANHTPVVDAGFATKCRTETCNYVVDEVRLYGHAITMHEMYADYLVGRWRLDGDSPDDSGRAQATIYGTANWTDGLIDGAFEFDGVSNYLKYSPPPSYNSILSTNSLTYESWIYTSAISGDIMGFGYPSYGYALRVANGKLVLAFQDEGGGWHYPQTATNIVPLNQWAHVAATYDANDGYVSFYINGERIAQVAESASSADDESRFNIGLSHAIRFTGRIDEVRVHGTTIDANAVYRSYLDGLTLGHFPFDEGAGSYTADTSGRQNSDAAIHDAMWADGRIGKALDFAGDGDYVDLGDNPYFSSVVDNHRLTYEAWIYPRSDSGDIVGFGFPSYAYTFKVQGGALKLTYLDTNDVWQRHGTGWDVVPVNQWSHVAVTFDAAQGDAIFYLNGAALHTVSSLHEVAGSAPTHMRVGHVQGLKFDGLIDEVRIYSQPLSGPEILRNYSVAGPNGFGAEGNDTGNPIGGGEGYQNMIYRSNLNLASSGGTDYLVTDYQQLYDAFNSIGQSTNTHIVFIPSGVTINMADGALPMKIPANVILASDRGQLIEQTLSDGALLYSDYPQTNPMFETDGEKVRITGLRVQGPDGQLNDGVNYVSSAGIHGMHSDFEVDNCEIYNFTRAGIYLIKSAEDTSPDNPHIHHNLFRDMPGRFGGYCVAHNRAAGHWDSGGGYVYDHDIYSLVEANRFDQCKHAIQSSGFPTTHIEARYNEITANVTLIGDTGPAHQFDVHKCDIINYSAEECYTSSTAGGTTLFHHNTFKYEGLADEGVGAAIKIRAVPWDVAEITNNWFWGQVATQDDYYGNYRAFNNLYTTMRTLW